MFTEVAIFTCGLVMGSIPTVLTLRAFKKAGLGVEEVEFRQELIELLTTEKPKALPAPPTGGSGVSRSNKSFVGQIIDSIYADPAGWKIYDQKNYYKEIASSDRYEGAVKGDIKILREFYWNNGAPYVGTVKISRVDFDRIMSALQAAKLQVNINRIKS